MRCPATASQIAGVLIGVAGTLATGCATTNSRAFVLNNIEKNGLNLLDAPLNFRDDAEVMLTAIREYESLFASASDRLKQSYDFHREAILVNPDVLAYFEPPFSEDRSLTLLAVRTKGSCLQHAAEKYRDDDEVVEMAVSQDGHAYRFASDRLRDKQELLWRACSNSVIAAHHMGEALRNDLGHAVDFFAKFKYGLNCFSDAVRNNPAAVHAAISCSPAQINDAGSEFLSDRACMLEAARVHGAILGNVAGHWQHDREFALTAVKSDAYAATYLVEPFLRDDSFIEEIIRENAAAIPWLAQRSGGLSEHCARVAENFRQALALLKINPSGKFDNSAEIIRNRYAVSAPGVRTQLEQLLGKEYLQLRALDTRPLCVAIFPDWDNNHGFVQFNGTKDNIDRLSAGYRVLYYDVSSEEEFREALLEGTVKCGQQANLLIIAGHGAPTSIKLGAGDGEGSALDISDAELFAGTERALVNGGIVMLGSCSTGAECGGLTPAANMARFIHSIFPNCTVYAPMVDTNFFIQLDGEGMFADPGYWTKLVLVIKPG